MTHSRHPMIRPGLRFFWLVASGHLRQPAHRHGVGERPRSGYRLGGRLTRAVMLRQRLISFARLARGAAPVATYKMIYGDEDTVAEETLEDIDSIEHEDGWVVLFRGDDAILRVQEDHVQSLELVAEQD
jgi:hypothetical protein